MKQKILNVFYFFSILILFGGFVFVYFELNKIAKKGESTESIVDARIFKEKVEEQSEENLVDETFMTEESVDEKISQALSTISGKTTTIVREVTPKDSKNITYISLGDSYLTISTVWVDVPGSAVYIDVINDYGSGAKVSWEASLKVAHPNGKAFARLFDNTNKIAVDYSEIGTDENDDYEQISSGFLPFWKGRNLYKVQIKSLNTFEISYTGGKIKVAY